MRGRLVTIGAVLSAAALAVPTASAAPATSAAPVASNRFEAEVSAAKAAMMADPAAALKHARAAVELSRTNGRAAGRLSEELTGRWQEGEALVRVNRPAEAKPIIDNALGSAARHLPNSKLHADLLKARAGVALMNQEVAVALSDLLIAHQIYQKIAEPRSQAIVLQNIGAIYLEARDYARALSYYDQADEAFDGDPALAISSHNNRANALKELGKSKEAELEYKKALVIARKMESALLEARILTNIASAQVLNGKLAHADENARAGLRLSINSAEGWEPYLWGVRAQVALARGDLQAGRSYIEKAFDGIDIAKTNILHRDFHDTARHIYARLGQFDRAYAHMAAFKRVDDEARTVAASTNSALMTARFDAANQRLRITRLKSGQIQRDAQLAASKQRMERLLLITVLGAIAALIVFCVIFMALVAVQRSRKKVSSANVRLTYAARHDALTGLANRSYMRELLGNTLERKAESGDQCALILVDLDRFKAVNDALGHGAGDELLRRIAARLVDLLPPGSSAGRLGGDEFAALIPGNGNREDLAMIANNIVEALTTPFAMSGTQVSVGASVGIAIGPQDGSTVDMLVRNADLALYRSKNTGGSKYTFYEQWMLVQAGGRMQLETDMLRALEGDQPHPSSDKLEINQKRVA
ncbi:MAG: diguanylate cyclase [Pseudomonadota bacterium]|nr:diguanylate cyclase [Pseudomonadota bacterium]